MYDACCVVCCIADCSDFLKACLTVDKSARGRAATLLNAKWVRSLDDASACGALRKLIIATAKGESVGTADAECAGEARPLRVQTTDELVSRASAVLAIDDIGVVLQCQTRTSVPTAKE